MSEEKILDRVRKLLAMANDDRGNENERDNALRMAHNLLTKHGLSLMQVEEHEKEQADPRGKFEDEGWSMNWTKQIRDTIARLFMVKYFYGRKINGTRCKHYFVGRESNAVTAMYMSAYVIENILKEGRRLYKHNLSPETRSFAQGCSNRLHQRVNEMIAAKAKEVGGTGSTALALLDLAEQEQQANEAFIREGGTQLTKGSRARSKVDASAYAAGHAHGGKISLNVQVARPEDLRLGGPK